MSEKRPDINETRAQTTKEQPPKRQPAEQTIRAIGSAAIKGSQAPKR